MLNFLEPLDQYCERIDDSFFAEPFNLFSNLAFIAAAVTLHRRLKLQNKPPPPGAQTLVYLIFAVGIGSSLFHSFANMWSQFADVIPIVIFVFVYLTLFLQNIAQLSIPKVMIMLAAFCSLSLAAAKLADHNISNGSEFYFGTWMSLMGMAFFYAGRSQSRSQRQMAIGAVLFSASLCFRTLDQSWCEAWPYGTHMFWHVLNGTVVYFITSAYISER